ncbi:sulfotransferase [soil metagenome]
MANGTTSKSNERGWSPRLWQGMDFFAWLRILWDGRGRVEFHYWYIAAIITWLSFVNTMLRWMQHARYHRAIDRIQLDPPPLFVLGHWRTGTTLLHELLSLDDRHASPTTHHCMEPNHLLFSEDFFREKLGFLLPDKRPMDNMPFGWDQPQEDEFALALLGEPSTYTELAFPNHTLGHYAQSTATPLDLSSLSPLQLKHWQRTLLGFLKTVSLLDRRRTGKQRRLVLKSPPHTARIPELLALFPDARFAFIRRDPVAVYLSTINLWTAFAHKHGLQKPMRPDLIEAKVLKEFRTIADRYEATKHLIPAGRLVEITYEELASDLVAGTKAVYDGLALGGWETVLPQLQEYAAKQKDYTPNKFKTTAEVKAKVSEYWGDIATKWGYV